MHCIYNICFITYKLQSLAKKRRRTSRVSRRHVYFDAKNIWTIWIIIWWLYFFWLYLASNSPLIQVFNQRASFITGTSWIWMFFGIIMVFWWLILRRWHQLTTLLKQCIIIMILTSSLLNFPVIDRILASSNIIYQQHWWFLSRPVIIWLQLLFWASNTVAIKAIIIMVYVLTILRLMITINIRLPRIKLQSISESTSSKKQPIKWSKDQSPKWTSFVHSTLSQDDEIKKKLLESNKESSSLKTSKGSALDIFFGKKDWKRMQWESTVALTEQSMISQSYVSESGNKPTDSKAFIKELLRNKVQEKLQQKTQHYFPEDKPTFSTTLMDHAAEINPSIDQEFLIEKAKALQNKLIEFGLPVHFEWVDRWPTIIQIKIKPEAGIRVSEVERLKADITSGLKAKSLRIIAPIPGTDLVWIEMPNPKPQIVYLWDVLSSIEFIEANKKSSTNLALGKSVNWSIMIKALESMPHLLIAWATGSGKSIWVNNFIFSLIYQNNPNELKFLMVDPKQVELEFFNGLPYLLAPIITKPENALKILKRSVDEMERRYETLKKVRVKNIIEYNEKIPEEKMYRIVIVIDELADLMMSGNKKEVELCITRIAQKARAIWMHLIVATQRPSVNVITGLIKANIPTRIAFWVVSQVDSRTILDCKWAEDLLGKGDMLYMDPGNKFPIRIQNGFISTAETERIITALSQKYMWWLTESDIYDPEIMSILEAKNDVWWSWDYSGTWWWDDDLIDKAIEVIMETRKASTTLLQRRLWVWFARAGKIMDILEQRGMVWPQDGAKPRDIYM